MTSIDATIGALKDVVREASADRLKGLLDYVEQVVKLDERPAFKLSEFRLANGQTYHFHQHEFHALPGITHDLTDEDGAIWLSVERLKRNNPPKPSDTLAPWLDLSPDPERTPQPREYILKTVSKPECDELVASGQVRAEDCAESFAKEAKGRFDVRLRLEDRPDISKEAETYVSNVWLPWSITELPRRRSIALYQKLFEVAQLLELGSAEQAIELVWGLGLSRWVKDGIVIDLPLLERLVEIEIDESAAGTIRIRPRQAQASINLRPYDELRIDGVPIAQDAARRAIDSAENDLGVSPYQRDTFEPILRACQTRLDPEGAYLPDSKTVEPTEPIPAPSSELAVSDRWVIIARKRSDNFLLQDIANLKASIDNSENELPGPSRTLVMGPLATSDAPWTPLSDTMGDTSGTRVPDVDETPLGDLFFPKPFNNEQVEIVRRLERTDGVVVQGPPGTGKTHTISNIICHYLAKGRRVLVVSHGEAALSVLRDQLPAEIRDLAISITTSEREGYKQLEGAVRLLQSIVESLRPNEQVRLIADLEKSIIGMRRRIAEIDAEIENVARAQLSAVPGQGIRPAELALSVVASRQKYEWFVDRPEVFSADSGLSDEIIARVRHARNALVERLEHLDAVFPSLSDLPSGKVLAQLHADILRANEFGAQASQDPPLTLRIHSSKTLELTEQAGNVLERLIETCRHLDTFPFLRPLCAPVNLDSPPFQAALETFLSEAFGLIADHKRFLQSPVTVSDDAISSPEMLAVVSRLAAGEKVFGALAFKERALRPAVEAIRVLSHAPANPHEWSHVRDYFLWRRRFLDVLMRWQSLAPELRAEAVDVTTLRQLSELASALKDVLVGAPRVHSAVRGALREVAVGDPPILWPDRDRMKAVLSCMRNTAAAIRLSAARDEVTRISRLFVPAAGRYGDAAKTILNEAVGRSDLAGGQVEEAWTKLLDALANTMRHRHHFDEVRTVADQVEQAGAPEWAERLRQEPVVAGQDAQTPTDWQKAWDWAAAQKFLSKLDQRQHLGALAEERAKLDAAVAKGFEQVVRERTFYALGKSMTGPVRAALMMFATALRKSGGKGKGAVRHRRDARKAMAACFDGVPCWIMPSWRVAEQLPGELGTFELVIMDEASQSDIKEVTALLRGKKILVVGDDKQVSPSAAFIENAKIDRLERTYLTKQPFKTLLLPGSSLYDLAKVMFPDKFIMLREHFRCVEPIIRFSTQFYTEALIPLRIPTAHERIDPPLVDIYVPDGRRTGDKINHREAEVVVEEVRKIVESPQLSTIGDGSKWRSIGVISLIGGKQAALINRMLLDALGEEIVLRHRIACGDSATFQGNERDIVFLSMVADPTKKQAQTAAHFEQRFNVAMSRARDRLYVVRSVREEELNPNDLKAKVLRHFADPMAGGARPKGDLAVLCDSDFERVILKRLLDRGFRVVPQVGALGYKIDLVVEGSGDRRLAIECDGDQYHGPERWAADMARQRVLERVGWRFWRCWSSSFTVDPEGCMADLFGTLDLLGIAPIAGDNSPELYTEYRVASGDAGKAPAESPGIPIHAAPAASASGIKIGDRIIVRYLDDNKTASFIMCKDRDDAVNGLLGVDTPLGKQLLGSNEEDEVEFEIDGRLRRVLVVKAARDDVRIH